MVTEFPISRLNPSVHNLFAFAAGEFETITREIDGRSVTMHHRESDVEKVQRNVDEIFQIPRVVARVDGRVYRNQISFRQI